MRIAGALAALAFCLLAGCESQPLRPSALQRLNEMEAQFLRLDAVSRQAAHEMTTLNTFMQTDQTLRARAQAVRLGQTATVMRLEAARSSERVGVLSLQAGVGKARPYFELIHRALGDEATEAAWLCRVSSVVGGDPLVTQPGHVQQLARLVAAARRAANAAVVHAGQARRWRLRSSRLLVYAPAR